MLPRRRSATGRPWRTSRRLCKSSSAVAQVAAIIDDERTCSMPRRCAGRRGPAAADVDGHGPPWRADHGAAQRFAVGGATAMPPVSVVPTTAARQSEALAKSRPSAPAGRAGRQYAAGGAGSLLAPNRSISSIMERPEDGDAQLLVGIVHQRALKRRMVAILAPLSKAHRPIP